MNAITHIAVAKEARSERGKTDAHPALSHLRDPRLLRELAYIDGRWTGAVSDERLAVTDPSSERVIARVARLGADEAGLALQLHALPAQCSFAVRLLRHRLMGASPGRPGDHEGGFDPALSEARGDAADFLDRPSYQRDCLISSFLFGGERRRLACWRTTAIMVNASITSETCRCQPCQERVSLWVSPSSVLAVSNASSIAKAVAFQ